MSKTLIAAIVASCLATAAAGLVEGRLTNRWGAPADLTEAGQRLSHVPEQIGDWQLKSAEPFDQATVEMLQCAGNFSRTYENVVTGDVVRVALIVGPPGPTAVHTPEICYSSRGQTIIQARKPITIRPDERPEESLWRMVFRANDVEQNRFSVIYGWTGADGQWRASVEPRYEYGGLPLLYKIQLAAPLADSADPDGIDICQRFLQDFLPALDATLFSSSPQ